MIVAIDGPAASGKGTLARRIAKHFGFNYLDTGALYRRVGLITKRQNGDPNRETDAVRAARKIGEYNIADNDLRTVEIGELASIVAQIPGVREAILDYQREFARKQPGAVLDGRDIGTFVCPDADVKLFVTADARERARRRHAELLENGLEADFDELHANLVARDERDRTRKIAPLKPADDAHLLDTSKLDIEAAFRAAVEIIDSHINR